MLNGSIYPYKSGDIVIKCDEDLAELTGLHPGTIAKKRQKGMSVQEIINDNKVSVRRKLLRDRLGLPVYWHGEVIDTVASLSKVSGYGYTAIVYHNSKFGKKAEDFLNQRVDVKDKVWFRPELPEKINDGGECIVLYGTWVYSNIRSMITRMFYRCLSEDEIESRSCRVYRLVSDGCSVESAVSIQWYKYIWKNQDGWVTPDIRIIEKLTMVRNYGDTVFRCEKDGKDSYYTAEELLRERLEYVKVDREKIKEYPQGWNLGVYAYYSSVKSFYGLNKKTNLCRLCRDDKYGRSLSEIVKSLSNRNRYRYSVKMEIDGKVYYDREKVCEKLGVSMKSVYFRQHTDGCSFSEAIEKVLSHTRVVIREPVFDGNGLLIGRGECIFRSYNEFCQSIGVDGVKLRALKYGLKDFLSEEEITDYLVISKKSFGIFGREYQGIDDFSKKTGFPSKSLYNILRGNEGYWIRKISSGEVSLVRLFLEEYLGDKPRSLNWNLACGLRCVSRVKSGFKCIKDGEELILRKEELVYKVFGVTIG